MSSYNELASGVYLLFRNTYPGLNRKFVKIYSGKMQTVPKRLVKYYSIDTDMCSIYNSSARARMWRVLYMWSSGLFSTWSSRHGWCRPCDVHAGCCPAGCGWGAAQHCPVRASPIKMEKRSGEPGLLDMRLNIQTATVWSVWPADGGTTKCKSRNIQEPHANATWNVWWSRRVRKQRTTRQYTFYRNPLEPG